MMVALFDASKSRPVSRARQRSPLALSIQYVAR